MKMDDGLHSADLILGDNIGKYQIVNLIHLLLLAFLALMPLLQSLFNLNMNSWLYFVSILLVASFLWSFISWYFINRTIFDPYLLFITSAFLFNGSAALLYLFKIGYSDTLLANFSTELLIKSVFLVTFSIVSIHFGAVLACSNKNSRFYQPITNEERNRVAFASIRQIGLILILVSLIPFLFFMRDILHTVYITGYSGIFQREAQTGFGAWSNVLSGFLIPGIYFLLIGGKDKKIYKIIAISLMGFYSISYLYAGSRNRALLPLVVFLWIWHKFVKRFNLRRFLIISLILIVIIFIVFPTIKIVRSIPGKERKSFLFYIESIKEVENPLIFPFAEMGGSLRNVAYTISLIPKERNYDFGQSYIYALLTIMPNLFWRVHPTIQRGTFSDWLVNRVNPYIAERGGGYGFSFIAEAYANFGWLGCLIVMLVLGIFIGKLSIYTEETKNPFLFAVIACFLPQLMFFTRGESALLIRTFAWYSLIPYILAISLFKAKVKIREHMLSLDTH